MGTGTRARHRWLVDIDFPTMTAASGSSDHHLDVGIGCISILPSSDEIGFEGAAWTEAIEEGLGMLSSVSDIEVSIRHVYEAFRPGDDDVADESDDDQNYDIDNGAIPAPFSFVRFSLAIPRRMHNDLMHHMSPPLASERFEVLTTYGFRGPVTFIRSLQPVDESDPSTYLVLVREFLRQEVERAKAPIRIVITGPSPFHVDFSLRPDDGKKRGLGHEWIRSQYGYDKVTFFYTPSETNSIDDAYRSLITALTEPFSTYYSMVRARNRRMRRSATVSAMSESLIAIHRRPGVRAWFAKTFRSGNLARELLLTAINAKQLDSEQRAYLSDELNDADLTSKLPFLVEKCEKVINTSFSDRLTMAQEIAKTLEGGRLSQYEVLILSSSTLLGAVAGAIAALIAAKP